MKHFGHFPGLGSLIWGCIEQVHHPAPASTVAGADGAARRPAIK